MLSCALRTPSRFVGVHGLRYFSTATVIDGIACTNPNSKKVDPINISTLQTLPVRLRYHKSKRLNKYLRHHRRIPGVVFNRTNGSQNNMLIHMEKKVINKLFFTPWYHNTLLRLQVEEDSFDPTVGAHEYPNSLTGEREIFEDEIEINTHETELAVKAKKTKELLVLPQAVQAHWIDGSPTHLAFAEYENGSKVKIEIPIRFENVPDCYGTTVQTGYLIITRQTIECFFKGDLTDNSSQITPIPREIEIDLKNAKINDVLTVNDIIHLLPRGVTLRSADKTRIIYSVKKV